MYGVVGGCRLDGFNDLQNFRSLVKALQELGVSPGDLDEIWKVQFCAYVRVNTS